MVSGHTERYKGINVLFFLLTLKFLNPQRLRAVRSVASRPRGLLPHRLPEDRVGFR